MNTSVDLRGVVACWPLMRPDRSTGDARWGAASRSSDDIVTRSLERPAGHGGQRR